MLTALLIDDEAPARIELRRLLSAHAEVAVAGEAATVRDALALTASLRPDVVFLDVQLVGESGFDYAARVPEPGPRIVFVTAYERHALRAFECNALDYLLKPVPPKRLAATLRRVRAHEAATRSRPAGEDDAVFIKADAVARFVPWRDIQRIETSGNYTRVHLSGGTSLIVLRPLKEWLALAPAGMFLQVRRTAIVRLDAIREIVSTGEKKHAIILRDGATVPIGRDHLPTLRAALGGI